MAKDRPWRFLGFFKTARDSRSVLHSPSEVKGGKINQIPKEERAKDLLFQHISHDLRSAYLGIGGICAILEERIALGQHITPEMLRTLIAAAKKYKYLLYALSDPDMFANGMSQKPNYSNVYVPLELKEIVFYYSLIAQEKNIHTEIKMEPGFPDFLITDKVKISRIFYNVYLNAIKFSAEGSTIRVLLNSTSTQWSIKILDEGPGVSPDKLAVISEPSDISEEDANFDNGSLGLRIIRSLMDTLQGKIKTQTTPGVGTSFELTFPILHAI